MSIKQEEGAARSPGSDESADDSHPLCREFGGANEAAEAYWEDYIQGKMDLVIDILQVGHIMLHVSYMTSMGLCV